MDFHHFATIGIGLGMTFKPGIHNTDHQCYEFWVIKVIPMNAERQKSSFEMPCGYICTYLEFGPMGPMQI